MNDVTENLLKRSKVIRKFNDGNIFEILQMLDRHLKPLNHPVANSIKISEIQRMRLREEADLAYKRGDDEKAAEIMMEISGLDKKIRYDKSTLDALLSEKNRLEKILKNFNESPKSCPTCGASAMTGGPS